ncbi:hypothetical protein FACS1894151_04010 [Spirochaetia bacterium]|nr:hypothetical protein FACS1894151_04010 [Spirochaetia bacterium]
MKKIVLTVIVVITLVPALFAQDWDTARLDTARNVSYLSQEEKNVVLELNKVRSDPKKYAEMYIKPRLDYFTGNIYAEPGKATRIQTSEGRRAVQDCYDTLTKMSAVPLLYPREGLSHAAKDHAADIGPKGTFTHDGSDRSTPTSRAQRYGNGYLVAGENISAGNEDSRDVVIQLLIDDGVSNRGHRVNNLRADYNHVGVAMGSHTRYTNLCVINFAGSYVTTNNRTETQEETERITALTSVRAEPDAANWPIDTLDTAKDAPYLSAMEKDIMLEINKLRSNPQKYARLYLPSTSAIYRTLNGLRTVQATALSRGLCLAAKDSNGSITERVLRYGTWTQGNIAADAEIYGSSAREIVINLVTANRAYILGASYRYVGFSLVNDNGLKGIFMFAENYTSAD